MTDRILNVLFLCAGNSLQWILAGSILRRGGRECSRAFSAEATLTAKVGEIDHGDAASTLRASVA